MSLDIYSSYMKTGNVGSDGGRSYSFYYLQLFMVQLDWVSETCRNIQVQVIKTTAFNNRLALKDSFGMDYSKLFPGSIFKPPSYSENFVSSSSGR